jgi:hypothetical protein
VSPRYIRNEPDRRETAAAALASGMLAAGVGVLVFYFLRLFLARDVASSAGVDTTDRRS